MNGNGTETVIDCFFGIPLFVSIYDSAGNLESVTVFGINVTILFELLKENAVEILASAPFLELSQRKGTSPVLILWAASTVGRASSPS